MKKLLPCIFIGSALLANPQGESVAAGSATINRNGTYLSIEASDQTIINWDSFSVGVDEITHFINDGWVLNHVTGGQRSEILGQLTSSGQLMLLNASGLYIGDQAVIEAKSFIGSTLDTIDFQGADFLFTGEGSEIVNLGTIRATDGNLYLISRSIDNQGSLEALGGEVGLATGTKILLRREGDKYFSFEMQSTEFTDPYEVAIHSSGHIEATQVEERGGRIFLVADDGCSQVTGTMSAGTVGIFGDEVFVTDSAKISAPSGRVMIGGDYQGSNQEVPNSLCTYVAEDVTIDVSGGEKGDAGSVIVWSDGTAEFYGTINARGGDEGGDGGFVEVSGLKTFVYNGRSDRRAPMGKAGKLLLDPEADIVINNTGPVSTGGSFTGSPTQFVPTALSPVIFNTELVAELALGDVEVVTNGMSVPTGGVGSVTIENDVIWSDDTEFAITAAQSITINSGVTVSNTGTGAGNAINFIANSGGTSTGTFTGIDCEGSLSATERDIRLTGTGGDTGTPNVGVLIPSTATITSTGTSAIFVTGNAGNGTTNNKGILINSGDLSTVDGGITLIGTGNGTGGNGHGIECNSNATIISTGSGNISLTGRGSDNVTSGGCAGISLSGNDVLISTSSTGNITMDGTGGDGAGPNIRGVDITMGVEVTSTSSAADAGTITITGVGGDSALATNTNAGVNLIGQLFAEVNSVSGDITITGTGGGTGSDNNGVNFNRCEILSTGTDNNAATISITGTGSMSATMDNNYGIYLPISVGSERISSIAGNITIMGTGGTGTTDNFGVTFLLGEVSSTGQTGVNLSPGTSAATISITGIGGDGTNNNIGVEAVSDTQCDVFSYEGDITIVGRGDGSGTTNHGCLIDSVLIESRDTAEISIDGRSSNQGTSSGTGVVITSITGDVTTVNGDISITGIGRGGVAANRGIELTSSGNVESTGLGDITLTGAGGSTGGTNEGIYLSGAGTLIRSTSSGSTTLVGTGGSDTAGLNYGILIEGGTVNVVDSSNITLEAGGTGVGGARGINVTGSDSSIEAVDGTISLTGDANGDGIEHGVGILSGATVGVTGGTINFNGEGNSIGFGGRGIITLGGGTVVSSRTGPINFTGNGAGPFSAQGIDITGSSIVETTTSGSISFTGTTDALSNASHGIQVGGTVRTAGAGPITIDGTGGSTGTSSFGVHVSDGGLVTSDSGAIDMTGRDSGGTEAGMGVNLFGAITSTSGPITLTTLSDMVITDGGTVTGGAGLLTLRPSRDLRITGTSFGMSDTGIFVGIGGLDIEAGRDILVSGASATTNDGQISGSIAAPAYDMVIRAGRNIEMTSPVGGGLARIFNDSTGALTLVVDNSFPTFPDFGTGAFILNSDLTAGGDLRIYTVEPSLNTINDTINGVAFVPGPFGEDTSTEQFSTYFSDGSYEGAAFKFYYKLPIELMPSEVALIQEIEAYSLQIALAELSDRLPIFKYMRLPNYPWHHPDFCQYNLCDPGFDPYGAFIFEDNVYWIGQ